MRLLKLLYYRYYWFQVKLGNADVAVFFPIILLSFLLMLFIGDILLFFSVFYPNVNFTMKGEIGGLVIIIWMILFYFLLVHNKKYKIIITNEHLRKDKKGKLIAILFPMIIIVFFVVGIVLKILQNNGKI